MNVETGSFNAWTAFDFAVTVEGVSVKLARVEFYRAIDSYILLNTLLIKECLISKQFFGIPYLLTSLLSVVGLRSSSPAPSP